MVVGFFVFVFSFSFQNSSTLDLPKLKLRLLMFVCLPCLYHIFMFVNKVLNSTQCVIDLSGWNMLSSPDTPHAGWASLFKIKLVLIWKTRRKRRSLGWGLFFFFLFFFFFFAAASWHQYSSTLYSSPERKWIHPLIGKAALDDITAQSQCVFIDTALNFIE